uniref:Fibronectin type-III domain-containing protein n=1 Tax=Timema genevievae TaxID=629358 RepID=A0A7R9PNJ8_TIMGE|nr:unnamed protein product [Timema genevievae]
MYVSVPGQVNLLRAIKVTTSSIQITWDSPLENKICLEEYQVCWDSNGTNCETIPDNNSTGFTIDNLVACTTYKISVAALGIWGSSDNVTFTNTTVSNLVTDNLVPAINPCHHRTAGETTPLPFTLASFHHQEELAPPSGSAGRSRRGFEHLVGRGRTCPSRANAAATRATPNPVRSVSQSKKTTQYVILNWKSPDRGNECLDSFAIYMCDHTKNIVNEKLIAIIPGSITTFNYTGLEACAGVLVNIKTMDQHKSASDLGSGQFYLQAGGEVSWCVRHAIGKQTHLNTHLTPVWNQLPATNYPEPWSRIHTLARICQLGDSNDGIKHQSMA